MAWSDSKGRRLLLKVLQVTTAEEVAARLRVDKGAVGHWASGENRPKEHYAEKLRDIYRIPVASWEKTVNL